MQFGAALVLGYVGYIGDDIALLARRSSDRGATWSAPEVPPRGDVATSVATVKLSTQTALLLEHSRDPRQQDFVLPDGRAQTLLSRSDSVTVVTTPMLTARSAAEAFALASVGDSIDGVLMPRSALTRLVVSCRNRP